MSSNTLKIQLKPHHDNCYSRKYYLQEPKSNEKITFNQHPPPTPPTPTPKDFLISLSSKLGKIYTWARDETKKKDNESIATGKIDSYMGTLRLLHFLSGSFPTWYTVKSWLTRRLSYILSTILFLSVELPSSFTRSKGIIATMDNHNKMT